LIFAKGSDDVNSINGVATARAANNPHANKHASNYVDGRQRANAMGADDLASDVIGVGGRNVPNGRGTFMHGQVVVQFQYTSNERDELDLQVGCHVWYTHRRVWPQYR
jgi:hypothetical protein